MSYIAKIYSITTYMMVLRVENLICGLETTIMASIQTQYKQYKQVDDDLQLITCFMAAVQFNY